MTVDVYYTVTYGKGDGSDTMESEVELTAEEEEAYKKALLLRIPLDEVPELEDALSRAYAEIEADEMDLSCELGDEYAQECEEDDTSPFDEGWSLDVYFPELEEYEVTREEAAEALTYLFSHTEGDYTEVDEYLERIGEDYLDFDEKDLAVTIALQMGHQAYAPDKSLYTFTIHISAPGGEGDSEIEYPVNQDELALIEESMDNGDSFEDVEDLSDLYERVMDAVPDKLEEDLQENNDAEIDPEDLDYTLDFE